MRGICKVIDGFRSCDKNTVPSAQFYKKVDIKRCISVQIVHAAQEHGFDLVSLNSRDQFPQAFTLLKRC